LRNPQLNERLTYRGIKTARDGAPPQRKYPTNTADAETVKPDPPPE
jgi:hypothetical protein